MSKKVWKVGYGLPVDNAISEVTSLLREYSHSLNSQSDGKLIGRLESDVSFSTNPIYSFDFIAQSASKSHIQVRLFTIYLQVDTSRRVSNLNEILNTSDDIDVDFKGYKDKESYLGLYDIKVIDKHIQNFVQGNDVPQALSNIIRIADKENLKNLTPFFQP